MKRNRLLKSTGISLLFHLVMVLFLSLNPWPKMKIRPAVYTVTLMPVPAPEPVIQKPAPPPPRVQEEKPKPPEKRVPEKAKKDDIVEKIKKPEKEKSLKHLEEAIQEIRRKAALDQIEKRVARRVQKEEVPASPAPVSPAPPVSQPVPPPRPVSESKLNEYYSKIWSKIKESWTIPENVLRETVDLETVIVVIIERDGRIQKTWFEKKSGDELYDQMALRAIRKAEPLPPLPRELADKSLEIGIRFFPD